MSNRLYATGALRWVRRRTTRPTHIPNVSIMEFEPVLQYEYRAGPDNHKEWCDVPIEDEEPPTDAPAIREGRG